jgi:lysozyme family protein
VATNNFAACLAFTLAPTQDGQPLHCTAGDPGGATDEGITLPSLAVFLNKPSVTVGDLQRVAGDPVQRSAFYATGYWQPVSGNLLPRGIDLMTFDFGVTDGPRTSAKVLQMALDLSGDDVDGWVGDETMRLLNAMPVARLITALAIQQHAHVSMLNPLFRNGWNNRIVRAVALAQSWCGPGAAPVSQAPPASAAPVVATIAQPTADDLDNQYNPEIST